MLLKCGPANGPSLSHDKTTMIHRLGFRLGLRPPHRPLDASSAAVRMLAVMLCALVPFVCVGCGRGDSGKKSPVKVADVSLRGPLPPGPPADFAGSESCRECHAAISDLYATHPMGRSMGDIASVDTIEQYPSGPIDIPGKRRYRVEREGDRVTHHEFMVDDDGEMIYDQGEEVTFAVGSGQRGRAFLISKDGTFRQSPIGWYSTSDSWDLSPGYSVGGHQRFQRRVGDGCLYCHAGHVDSIGQDRYADPPFTESAISCERCHGPAAGHVAFHRDKLASGPGPDKTADRIVNPAKLSVQARESVCNQCHLQGLFTIPRYGKTFNDFRPGELMEDTFVCLVGPQSSADGQPTKVVSQVEQMRQSRCYVATEGQLGCTSCHDPHAPTPSNNRVAYFRDRCNACHADQGCSLPEPDRQAAPALGSCVHCHMPSDPDTNVPHTAQTDHRILRDPLDRQRSRRSAGKIAAAPQAALNVFGDSERIPPWEQSRAMGIAMMTQAWNTQNVDLARQAVVQLVPPTTLQGGADSGVTALTPDTPALNELGAYFWLSDKPDEAAKCWAHVLELDAQNETALAGMAMTSRRLDDATAAVGYVDRLLAITPDNTQWLTQRTKILWELEQRDEALQTAETLLRVDPTLVDIRQWLADAYRSESKPDQAEPHETILRKMRAADQAASR
jgi:hypothetical protein